MVWASIAITMPGTIHFIEGKLLGEGYRDLLRDVLFPNARQILGASSTFWMIMTRNMAKRISSCQKLYSVPT